MEDYFWLCYGYDHNDSRLCIIAQHQNATNNSLTITSALINDHCVQCAANRDFTTDTMAIHLPFRQSHLYFLVKKKKNSGSTLWNIQTNILNHSRLVSFVAKYVFPPIVLMPLFGYTIQSNALWIIHNLVCHQPVLCLLDEFFTYRLTGSNMTVCRWPSLSKVQPG